MSKRIAWYLRDAHNLHYFATMRPYLQRYMECVPAHSNHLVLSSHSAEMKHNEYRGFSHLFSVGEALDDFDLVVTPSWLRPDEHPLSTPTIQIFHGISDKPFTIERDFSRYNLVLCIGQRQLDRLRATPCNQSLNFELVGYAKFDELIKPVCVFPDSKRPVLIYAPTWTKGGFSSIQRFLEPGIVESLVEHFDLLIKPHPNIFNPDRPYYNRNIVNRLAQLDTHEAISIIQAGNILPYFASADACIADVSSAGYEWLWFDRPTVFLNPNPQRFIVDDDNPSPVHLWQAGEICNDPQSLVDTVTKLLNCDCYSATRKKLLNDSIYLPYSCNAAVRGVDAIRTVLND